MGFAPGGGLPIDIGYSLAALVATAAMVLPGLGVAWGLGRRARWDLATVVAAAFAFEMGTIGVVALAAYYLGLTLDAVLVLSVAVLAAASVVCVYLGRGGKLANLSPEALGIAILAAVGAVIERPWFGQADTFYHLAAVRSLLVTQRPMVTDPFYRLASLPLDPTTGVWHTQLAVICRATGLDVLWLWPGAVAAGAAMTLLGFWVLCRAVSRSRRAATAATVAFAAFGLMLDMRWFAYPNRMSLALVFVTLAAVTELMDRPGLPDAALLVAAGFSAVSLHLAAAAAVALACLLLVLLLLVAAVVDRVRGAEQDVRALVAMLATGAVLVALAAPAVLPKVGTVAASSLVGFDGNSVFQNLVHLPGGLLVANPAMIGPTGWGIVILGGLLAVLAAGPAFRDRDRRSLVAVGLGALPIVLLIDPPLSSPLLHASPYLTYRIAMLLPFVAFVAAAWGLSRAFEGRSSGRDGAVVSVLGLALVAALAAAPLRQVFFQVNDYFLAVPTSRPQDIRLKWGPDVIARMAAEFDGRYPVVAGDTNVTYYLAGVLPVAVVAAPSKHSPFAVEERDGEARRADVVDLMSPTATEAQRRAILDRRGADFVVVALYDPASAVPLAQMRAEKDLLAPVVESRSLVLFRVLR